MGKVVCLFSFLLACVATAAQKDSANVSDIWLVDKFTRLADWGMDLITIEKENSTIFFLPNAGYEERSGLSIGVMPSWRFYLGNKKEGNGFFRPSNINMNFEVSTTGMYEVYLSSNFYTPRNWYYKNKILGQYIPEKLYSFGNVGDKDIYKDIDVNKFEFTGSVMKIVQKEWFLGIVYDLNYYDVSDPEPSSVEPFVYSPDHGWNFGIGPSFILDTRNNVIYPRKGWYVEGSWLTYLPSFNDYDFSSLTLDVREFMPIGEKESALGFQLYAQHVSGEAPFYRLAVLGGKRLFRGITQPYKYLADNAAYFQVAFRSKLWWRFGYELFTGVGNVSDDLDSSMFKDGHYMGGVGLRFRILENEKLSFRFDYGKANNDDGGFYFTLGEAF